MASGRSTRRWPSATAWEQKALLRITRSSIWDHTLVSLTLGTGLRLQELIGLDIGDVAPDGATVRTRVRLPPAKVFRRMRFGRGPERTMARLQRLSGHTGETGGQGGPLWPDIAPIPAG